jgi:hypothetical protein
MIVHHGGHLDLVFSGQPNAGDACSGVPKFLAKPLLGCVDAYVRVSGERFVPQAGGAV